jgi:tetratricopeptide (TPR) repeat protein
MKFIRPLLIAPLVACLVGPVCAQSQNADVQTRFKQAVTLSEQGRFADAVPILEALAKDSPSEGVFWNLGLAEADQLQHGKALEAWLAYQQIAPDDWRARTKLIQTYQALGNLKARDEEREALVSLWGTGKNADLSKQELFCREQIRLGKKHVFVLEYFRPAGERRVFYSFIVTEPGTEQFKISLGSYDATNQVSWEMGELPRDKRLYHLDLYRAKAHETYAFYRERPSYDDVRAQVVAILAGEVKPMSSTHYP